MAKDEFDFDFDFEKEFGLDPNAYTDDQGFDDDMTFTDAELGLDADSDAQVPDDDFDFSSMDDILDDGQQEDAGSFSREYNFDDPEEDFTPPGFDPQDPDDDAAEMVARRNIREAKEEEEATYQEPEYEAPQESAPEEEAKEAPKHERRERKKTEYKTPKAGIFTKFVELYFTPIFNKEALQEPPQDPDAPRRRRKKTKMQIFKEVYLPPIIVVICLILVMSFAVGAISNVIAQRKTDKLRDEIQLQESQSAEDLTAQTVQRVLQEASDQAAIYNYEEAITILEDFLSTVDDKAAYPEITQQRSAYVTAQSQLVEYMDPSMIPNLSFHTLMVDPARSLRDAEYGGLYNRNFVSIGEFQKILDQLYNNGYVLVDFDSFTDVNGEQIFPENIMLPPGKKPVMITATMVNYWAYMVDSDGDNVADAGGDGFANKLVLDGNGDIKASYIDSNGAESIGDYDLIPILETFIKEHPGFSYRGARATVAVAGKEGVFGYRINSSYIATNSQTFVDGQIVEAKKIAQALRDKGYTLACYTYANIDYGKKNANQIMDDLNKWDADIVSVIGPVDVFVFAQFGDLTDYNGASFKVMQEKGFKFFVANADKPWAEVRSDYVRQKRLMVTGNALGWKQTVFEGIFDANAVVDMATRVSIPN